MARQVQSDADGGQGVVGHGPARADAQGNPGLFWVCLGRPLRRFGVEAIQRVMGCDHVTRRRPVRGGVRALAQRHLCDVLLHKSDGQCDQERRRVARPLERLLFRGYQEGSLLAAGEAPQEQWRPPVAGFTVSGRHRRRGHVARHPRRPRAADDARGKQHFCRGRGRNARGGRRWRRPPLARRGDDARGPRHFHCR